MHRKFALLLAIIALLTVGVSVWRGRKALWSRHNTRTSRAFTWRSLIIIGIIIIFLFFSMIR